MNKMENELEAKVIINEQVECQAEKSEEKSVNNELWLVRNEGEWEVNERSLGEK